MLTRHVTVATEVAALSAYRLKGLRYIKWRDADTRRSFPTQPLGLAMNRTLLETFPLLCVNLIRVP